MLTLGQVRNNAPVCWYPAAIDFIPNKKNEKNFSKHLTRILLI